MLLHSTVGKDLNFLAIFLHRLIAIGTKLLRKHSKRFYGIVQVKYTAGMKNWRFSTNISLYFKNGTRYGHNYNGRRIGTGMRLPNGAVTSDLE